MAGEASGEEPSRAFDCLTLEEEKHALLGYAHLALAAKCRYASVEETRTAVKEAWTAMHDAKEELLDGLNSASPEVLADRATMLVALSAEGIGLSLCSEEFQNDPEMVLAACRDHGSNLADASPEIRANRDIVLQAAKLHGSALEGASEELKADREIVLAAVKSNPFSLRSAGGDLTTDSECIFEALKAQTRRSFLTHDRNVLSIYEKNIQYEEFILEAARVDGKILAWATPELKKDKDFVLEVMRAAPSDDKKLCYNEADRTVRNAVSFEDFQGACGSVLASRGEEDAPVLTVTMCVPTASSSAGCLSSSSSCEVSLLSGASFTCHLPAPEVDSNSAPAAKKKAKAKAKAEQGSKRRRVTTATAPALSLSQLADRLKKGLAAHAQADPPPVRIFIVFKKRDAEGEDASVPVTPWDWNRPITDFC